MFLKVGISYEWLNHPFGLGAGEIRLAIALIGWKLSQLKFQAV